MTTKESGVIETPVTIKMMDNCCSSWSEYVDANGEYINDEVIVRILNTAAATEQRLAALEARYRKQGHLYFNLHGTGRRLFWTEAGWELEPHSYDPEGGYVFETVIDAFNAVDEQGEPLEALAQHPSQSEVSEK